MSRTCTIPIEWHTLDIALLLHMTAGQLQVTPIPVSAQGTAIARLQLLLLSFMLGGITQPLAYVYHIACCRW